jgi:hypothetical protein
LTLLRKAQPGDGFYQPNTYVIQYLATYKFNDLPKTPLKKGQVTAQRLVLFRRLRLTGFVPLETPSNFAITGGTDAYDERMERLLSCRTRPMTGSSISSCNSRNFEIAARRED